MVAKPSASAISVASVANATELKASRPSVMSKLVKQPALETLLQQKQHRHDESEQHRQRGRRRTPTSPGCRASRVRGVSRGLSAENPVATLRRP